MAEFFGNLGDRINFNELVTKLTSGHQDEFYAFGKDGNLTEDVDPNDRNFVERVHAAGYKDPIGCDTFYYPYYHFDEIIVYQLDKIFNSICTMCWIDQVKPGRAVIPHQDYDDRERLLEKYGTLKRYHIHIGDPEPGHVFVLKDHAHHMEAQGNCYLWDDHMDWHSASNSGLTPKYILSYRGIIPHPEHAHRFQDYEYIWSDIEESVRIKIKNPVKVII
jgi:hypothetical protein